MADTKISWADKVWNPLRGCSMAKGSETKGCLHCYAAGLAARNLPELRSPTTGKSFAKILPSGPRWTGKVELIRSALNKPLSWRKPKRVFVNSMSDLFHESVPFEMIDEIFTVMIAAPKHTYMILTKRAERMFDYFKSGRHDHGCGPDRASYHLDQQIWLGVSVEDQATADARIPFLVGSPATKRFVSYEPALGPIDFTKFLSDEETHESFEASREDRISGGYSGRDRDRRDGSCLETEEAQMGLAETKGRGAGMQQGSSRELHRGREISASRYDVFSQGIQHGCPSIGVSSFQGTDTGWHDSESRGRQQDEQSSRQSHARDIVGTNQACLQNRAEIPMGRAEPCCKIKESRNTIDSRIILDGKNNPEGTFGALQRSISNDIAHCERGEQSETERSYGGLCSPKKSTEKSKRSGSISMIIIGCESGPQARPFDEDWARSTRDACLEWNVKFFFKQKLVGRKKVETPELDGRKWMQFPEVANG